MIKIKKNYFKVKPVIKKLILNRVMACAYIKNRIAYIFGIDIPPFPNNSGTLRPLK